MQRSCGLATVISRPFRWISPASGARPPAIRLKSVVLPAPFGPMIPSASPCATDRSISSAAMTEPKLLRSPLVGDDDVVFITVLHAPLAADQRCLCDVFCGEWWQVRSVPLYLADHGIETGRGDRSDHGFGIALRRTLQRIDGDLEQRMHEADRLRPLFLGRSLIAGGEIFRTHAGE